MSFPTYLNLALSKFNSTQHKGCNQAQPGVRQVSARWHQMTARWHQMTARWHQMTARWLKCYQPVTGGQTSQIHARSASRSKATRFSGPFEAGQINFKSRQIYSRWTQAARRPPDPDQIGSLCPGFCRFADVPRNELLKLPSPRNYFPLRRRKSQLLSKQIQKIAIAANPVLVATRHSRKVHEKLSHAFIDERHIYGLVGGGG
jgi:hypothetical protein